MLDAASASLLRGKTPTLRLEILCRIQKHIVMADGDSPKRS